MKVAKYILGILFIITGLRVITQKSIIAGIAFALLGVILLPKVSDKLKENVSFWQNKIVRYVSYIVLFTIAGATVPKSPETSSPKSDISKTVLAEEENSKEKFNKQQAEEQDKKKKLLASFETCDFVGQKSYIIPDFNGANFYTVLQSDFGFTVTKNFKNGVDYFCTKEMPRKFDYKVNIIGCSPSEIIGVTAAAIDYGIGQNEVMGFIRYIAISTCRENDVEAVRNWVEANIGNESSETTIGGITFLLSHSGHSTTLQVSVEEKNILAN